MLIGTCADHKQFLFERCGKRVQNFVLGENIAPMGVIASVLGIMRGVNKVLLVEVEVILLILMGGSCPV